MIVDTAQRASELVAPFFEGQEGESVAVLHLAAGGKLLGTTFSPMGGADGVDLPVREILASALRMGADSVLIAHNHPSGDPSPSEEDLAATRRLADAASASGIRLVDHLIFAAGEWRSFRELGLL